MTDIETRDETRELTARELLDMLEAGDSDGIRRALADEHSADIAALLADMPPERIAKVLLLLPHDRQGTLFGYFDHETQVEMAETALSRRDMARIFEAMPHDERADLFSELSEAQQHVLLPGLAQAEREDLRRLAAYEEDTVGAVMTSDYATIPPHLTVSQALEHLRDIAPDSETIYHSYVIDADRKLVGTVSLRDMIVAPPGTRVEKVMRRDPPFITADAPREEAVGMIAKYDLLALPVINGGEKLAGIVTYDDAMDVAEEETNLAFQKTGGVQDITMSIRDAPLRLLYQKRVMWLVLLVFGNLFSGAGIAHFEEVISAHLPLLFFLPLLIASSGNAGAQAATLMIRSLATGDVHIGDWGRMLGREILVATALGLTMAVAIAGIGLWRGGADIATVVSLTMVIVVIVGSLIGMSLPFVLSRLEFDPATASAPLVTSLADICGVLIYFGMAAWMLSIPAPL